MHLPLDNYISTHEFETNIQQMLQLMVIAADNSSIWYFDKTLDQLVADGEGHLYASLLYLEQDDLILVGTELNTIHATDSEITRAVMYDRDKLQAYVNSCERDKSLLRMSRFNLNTEIVTPIEDLNVKVEDLTTKKSHGYYSALAFRIK